MNHRRLSPRFAPKRSTIAIALALSLGLTSTHVYAFGFGEPEISSVLGQPLRMRIALQPDPEVDLSPQCLRLLGSPRDPLPTLTLARLSIEEKGAGRILHIESLNPINEPILRVTVEAGCAQHVRREFTVLLDPPAPYLHTAALAPSIAATLDADGNSNVAPPGASIATEVATAPQLDLGVARIQGRVGQPLFMQIPISGKSAAGLDNSSVRSAQILASDGTPLPKQNQAQVSLTHADTNTTLQLVTPDAVSEPALRVVVEVATASVTVRREYGVLLDMPAPEAKTAEANPSAAMPELQAPAPVAVEADAKRAPAATESPAQAPTPPAAPALKPNKHATHRLSKVPASQNLPPAPVNTATAEPAHAPAGGAKSGTNPALDKAPVPDHLAITAPDDQSDMAAKRFAEMDQRVKDLTQEIVKLRSDLAAQKQHEAELVAAQGTISGGSWILAILGAVGAGLAAFMLWSRRRSGARSWNPASWEDVNTRFDEAEGRAEPPSGQSASQGAAGAPAAAVGVPVAPLAKPTPKLFARSLKKTDNAGVSHDPITISALTTPIEVTEVQAHEPSIEQLYTLFYDIGGNTTPGGAAPPSANTPQPSTALPPVTLPKHDNLDFDLGIPESVQSARAARAQGALKAPASGSATAAPAQSTKFTYEEKSAPARASVPTVLGIDQTTSAGPMTEMPRDTDFAQTQPGLDLDLTTNIEPGANTDLEAQTEIGPMTVLPMDVDYSQFPAKAAAQKKPELELDLTTNLGSITQLGPLTEMPRDEEGPETRVELDLDLNTNVRPLKDSEDGADRESDPFAITTIPGNWTKTKN